MKLCGMLHSPIEAYILVHLHTSLVAPLNRAPWLAPLHGETIEEATTAKVVIKNRRAGKPFIHPHMSQCESRFSFLSHRESDQDSVVCNRIKQIHADSDSGQALLSKKLFYINFSLFTR
jgi:hypothetical protein